MREELKKIRRWDFNVFTLAQHTEYALAVTTETALQELHLIAELELNEAKLRRFLKSIQKAYQDLPYHNYLHATDVTQTAFHICTDGFLLESVAISNLGSLAMLIGATIHDVGHPGVTGKFLIANSAPLAIQYNDSSPLENMHLATAFTLWGESANNFTEKMPRILYKDLRKMIIDMVLSTDNDMHFTLVGKLNEMIANGDLSSNAQSGAASPAKVGRSGTIALNTMSVRHSRTISTDGTNASMKRIESSRYMTAAAMTTTAASRAGSIRRMTMKNIVVPVNIELAGGMVSNENTPRGRQRVGSIINGEGQYIPLKSSQLLVLQAALHAADISGPAKPWEIHMRWTSLVMDEFYKQGDRERELGVPITFAFDRHNPVPMPKFQLVCAAFILLYMPNSITF